MPVLDSVLEGIVNGVHFPTRKELIEICEENMQLRMAKFSVTTWDPASKAPLADYVVAVREVGTA